MSLAEDRPGADYSVLKRCGLNCRVTKPPLDVLPLSALRQKRSFQSLAESGAACTGVAREMGKSRLATPPRILRIARDANFNRVCSPVFGNENDEMSVGIFLLIFIVNQSASWTSTLVGALTIMVWD